MSRGGGYAWALKVEAYLALNNHACVICCKVVIGCIRCGERSKLLSGYIENGWIEKGCWRRDNDQRASWLRDASTWKEHEDTLDNDKKIGSLLYTGRRSAQAHHLAHR